MNIEKEIRFLKIYATVATLACAIVFLTAFASSKLQKFDDIEVKRINVVDDDGKLRMVISNKDRQHHGIAAGKSGVEVVSGHAHQALGFQGRSDAGRS